MEKYLFFNTGTNDSVCYPLSKLTTITIGSADGTSLNFAFEDPFPVADTEGSGSDDPSNEQLITLTITDNKGKEVFQAIADELRSGLEPFVVIADDTASEFLHSDIVSVASITPDFG